MMKPMLRASSALLALGTAASLSAQTATVGVEDATGDIIVTATRRAQALSDVPIAVSAISEQQLLNSGVTDLRTLNQLAPSLLVSGATSEVNFTARIRGVGTVGENPGIESSVALFIDGVYRSRTGTGLTDLGEIERIEVLRGPQGTLFGRNASAGLISITTKQPQFTNEFGGAFTYGNYDNIRIEGAGNVLLVPDRLAVRLEGLWHRRDGFIEDTLSDRTFNDRNRWMVRGQARWEPTDRVSVRLIADYSKRDEECCAATVQTPRSLVRDAQGNVVAVPNTLVPILNALGARIPFGEEFKVAISPNRDYRSDATDWGISGEVNWDVGFANLTSITAWRDYINFQGQDSDFEDLDIWGRSGLKRHFKTFTQELRLQGELFDDRLDWLVGGYFARETLRVEDDLRFGADIERYGDCLVVAGLQAQFPGTLNPALPRCTILPVAVWPGYAGLAQAFGVARLPGTGVGPGTFFDHVSRNWAFFTHNVIALVPDRLELTLGGRYTNERKEIDAVFNMTNTLCAALRNVASGAAALPCAINGTAGPGIAANDPNRVRKEDEFTGTVVLSWKPVDGLMVYGSWARGYKAGGFNLDPSALDIVCNPNAGTPAQRAACAAQLARPANTVGNARPEAIDLQFAPETVESIELGAKFTRPGFTANLALFRSAFSNFQLNTFNGVNFEVTNIAGCRDSLAGADTDPSPTTGACDPDRLKPGVIAKGVELEAFASPVEDLSLTAGITYTSTKYARDLVGTQGRPLSPVLFQLPGRQISNAVPLVVTGSAGWNPRLGNTGLRALLYADFRMQGDVNTGSDLDLEKEQDSTIVVNARIGVQSEDRRWSLELWAQNLFDVYYQQIAADMPLHGSGTFRAVADGRIASANQLFLNFPGEPRTFGVTARVRF
ncbi:MAG: TonB-dependent receptor [Sphingomonadaceae bacterium]|uniref:TonB-dependent receptor n=1 Tax=Thermaurantiacus sp. TaxID=2820283 RepID=UPI00298EEBF9|nr:TonB-dependent receptor [Thermaurantiacus sp.]MCS6986192.1 TonB-dependent receptor [Sphingomonadaceae bacterium]MDW8415899.1 TonB-dependent receptor [Thermaurantiacus sp.]